MTLAEAMDFIPDSAIQALAAHKFQSAGYTWLDAPRRGSTEVFWTHGFLLFMIYFPCLSMIQTMSSCHWTLPAAEEKMDPFWTCPLAAFFEPLGAGIPPWLGTLGTPSPASSIQPLYRELANSLGPEDYCQTVRWIARQDVRIYVR